MRNLRVGVELRGGDGDPKNAGALVPRLLETVAGKAFDASQRDKRPTVIREDPVFLDYTDSD